MLFTRHLAAQQLRLLSAGPEPHDIRLDAAVLAADEEQGLVLLEAQPLGLLPVTTPIRLESVRGRRGGKAAEVLFLLQPVHQRSADMRSTQRSGFAKAVFRALAAICPDGEITLPLAWLALELAARGYCSRSDLARTCRRASEALPDMPPGTLQCPGFVVLTEWADREAVRSLGQASRLAARNPLFRHLDTCHLREWCGGCDGAIAGVVLSRLALHHGLTVEADPLGEAVVLPQAEGLLTGQQRRLVEEVHDLYLSGKGLKHDLLIREFAHSANVIAWMFEAHQLVENVDGFVLSRRSLDQAFTMTGARLGHAALPGTGEVKSALHWPRQLAEAYRRLLEVGIRKPVARAPTRESQSVPASRVRRPGRQA